MSEITSFKFWHFDILGQNLALFQVINPNGTQLLFCKCDIEQKELHSIPALSLHRTILDSILIKIIAILDNNQD